MHSRIIQLETEPVPENERLSDWDIESDHWFLYSVADYVAEDEDRAHSLEWFKEILRARRTLTTSRMIKAKDSFCAMASFKPISPPRIRNSRMLCANCQSLLRLRRSQTTA